MRTLIVLVSMFVVISMLVGGAPCQSWAQPQSMPLYLLDVSPERAPAAYAAYPAVKEPRYKDLYYWDGKYWGQTYDFVYGYGYGYQYGHPKSWGQPRDKYRYSKKLRNRYKKSCGSYRCR